MQLQPYFPEPVTVAGNVAEAKSKVRVRFVRRVIAGHYLSVLSVVGVALLAPVRFPAGVLELLVLAGLIALTLQRRTISEGIRGNVLSVLLLAPTLYCLGQLMRSMADDGWPVVALGIASTCLAVYALFCGDDFSYIGQFVLCAAATAAALVALRLAGYLSAIQAWSGGVVATTYLFYIVYDLSMLVKRRRRGEEVSAVADLYRDLLNFVTYSVRVYFHWRRFRFI